MTARGMLVIHMIQAKDGKVTCMALLEVLIVLAHCKQHRGEANTDSQTCSSRFQTSCLVSQMQGQRDGSLQHTVHH